ncbi:MULTISPECIES: hypothetical protein [unclassified Pseudomonas]|uniref:hypothetical protein n=1 Tax=unclassified Pseudomonas TaxID=196821 RepID=UPI001359D141|nr:MULTISPECIES: hypothetical protein [unclassified Pseudomonas]WNZ83155.1 hypothetical protein QOM10_23105 [Pseudomonas sp. P108]
MKKVSVHGGDPELVALLDAWLAAVERYSKVFTEDNCWWYNERATLSTLAGAAWSLDGWVAIEEFNTSKRGNHLKGVDSGALRRGRCDLVISSPKTSFAIEAKQAWQPITGEGDLKKYVRHAQALAWADCWLLSLNEADRRFAVTFIVPTLSITDVRLDDGLINCVAVRRKVADWLELMGKFRSRPKRKTSFAYIFPESGGSFYCNSRHHFPGVVVVFEEMSARATRPLVHGKNEKQ